MSKENAEPFTRSDNVQTKRENVDMTYERQAMVSLLRSPGMVFYHGGNDKCALLRTVANQIETDGNRIEAQAQQIDTLTKAHDLWCEKTEWVQTTAQTQELGLHRADVLRLRIEALEAENERLRAALQEPHWFYLGDDCSSDQCRFGIDECISEDFEWDNPAKGDHVLQISGARPVPDMWIALHYFTDAEKDERDDDEPYAYTVHATEEAARAALAGSAEQ